MKSHDHFTSQRQKAATVTHYTSCWKGLLPPSECNPTARDQPCFSDTAGFYLSKVPFPLWSNSNKSSHLAGLYLGCPYDLRSGPSLSYYASMGKVFLFGYLISPPPPLFWNGALYCLDWPDTNFLAKCTHDPPSSVFWVLGLGFVHTARALHQLKHTPALNLAF